MSGRQLRVAIASPGVGLVQRGFERLMRDLYELQSQRFDVTLFKGGGPALPNEVPLRFLPRNGRVLRSLPLHRLIGRTPLHVECLTFALAMLPHLRGARFDLVHVLDPPLARLLWHLRRALGLRFRLLYTEGCAMPPGDYPPADHIHQVSPVTMAEAAEYGHDPAAMTMLPCGFEPTRFAVGEDRETLRQRHNVGADTLLVMAVSAINRAHKRTHHLIEEVAGLEGDVLLWLDGSLDHGDPELLELAHRRLGDRVRITHLPSDRVGELYRMADVMPHAATFESFGLAVVEAAASGVAMLIHDAPHFRWLLPNPAMWVDMTAPGALRARLQALVADRGGLAGLRLAEPTRARFAWDALADDYARLYADVAS